MVGAASEAIRDIGDESVTTQTTSRRPNPLGEKDLQFDAPCDARVAHHAAPPGPSKCFPSQILLATPMRVFQHPASRRFALSTFGALN